MLSQTEIDHFHQEGYLIFESLLDQKKVDHFTTIFDELVDHGRTLNESEGHFTIEYDFNREFIPGVLHKVQGVCVAESRILEIAKEPLILDRIESLIGHDIDVFGTKFFPKQPGRGHSVYWHQDNYYFGTTTDQVISCAIYYEQTDEANGCLRIVPRSHLSCEIVPHERNPTTHGSWAKIDESEAIDVAVPPGTAVFFSANLLHGAHDNTTDDRTRYSTAWHYIPGSLSMEHFPRGVYRDRHVVRGN